jgi:micrococcal nuclease
MKKTLVFLLCFSLSPTQSRHIVTGTVVTVYDGDTVKVRSDKGFERRVRLIGIDTPEISDTTDDTPLEALLAKRFTFHHIYRKRVRLSYDQETEDKYGRLLAYVWTEDGLFNDFILKEGFARVFLKFPFALKNKFIHAQKEAQEQGRGFWHQESYPLITAQQVRDHIGTLNRVRFLCGRLTRSGDFLFLQAKYGDFAALIPEAYLSFFDDIQRMKGRFIQVFGFVEEYKGQPQIMLFFPSQIGVESQHLTFPSNQIFNILDNWKMSNVETRPLFDLTEGCSWFKQ